MAAKPAAPKACGPNSDAANSDAAYTIAGKRTLLHTPDARVTLMTLAPGEGTPWHTHTHVTDTALRLDGAVEVQARQPNEVLPLAPGEPCVIAPGRPHRVVNAATGKNDSPCRFLLIQGVGPYDFIPL